MSMGEEPNCPACGAGRVQGQLIPAKTVGRGILTGLMTGDAAATLMATQAGDLIVHAFCVGCGAIWIPGSVREEQLRALSGQLGEEARREVEAAIKRVAERFNCPGCNTNKPTDGSRMNLYGVRHCADCVAAGRL